MIIVLRGFFIATLTNWKQNGVLITIIFTPFVKSTCRAQDVRETPSHPQTAGLRAAASATPSVTVPAAVVSVRL